MPSYEEALTSSGREEGTGRLYEIVFGLGIQLPAKAVRGVLISPVTSLPHRVSGGLVYISVAFAFFLQPF